MTSGVSVASAARIAAPSAAVALSCCESGCSAPARSTRQPPTSSGITWSGAPRGLVRLELMLAGSVAGASWDRPQRHSLGVAVLALVLSVAGRLIASAGLLGLLGRGVTGTLRLLAFALFPIVAPAKLRCLLVSHGLSPESSICP